MVYGISMCLSTFIFGLLSSFCKNETRLVGPTCFCVGPTSLVSFFQNEPIFMKLSIYIMTSETISTVYFINPCHQSVCVSLLSFLGNGSVKNCRCNEYKSNNRRNVGRVVFYDVRVISRKETISPPRIPYLVMYKYTLLFF
jgi:hypothetical protein